MRNHLKLRLPTYLQVSYADKFGYDTNTYVDSIWVAPKTQSRTLDCDGWADDIRHSLQRGAASTSGKGARLFSCHSTSNNPACLSRDYRVAKRPAPVLKPGEAAKPTIPSNAWPRLCLFCYDRRPARHNPRHLSPRSPSNTLRSGERRSGWNLDHHDGGCFPNGSQSALSSASRMDGPFLCCYLHLCWHPCLTASPSMESSQRSRIRYRDNSHHLHGHPDSRPRLSLERVHKASIVNQVLPRLRLIASVCLTWMLISVAPIWKYLSHTKAVAAIGVSILFIALGMLWLDQLNRRDRQIGIGWFALLFLVLTCSPQRTKSSPKPAISLRHPNFSW
jgi:hypothetical protein